MPNTADLLGIPVDLPFEGEVYKLRPPTLTEQAMFSRRLENRALAAAGRVPDMPPEEQAALRAEALRQIAIGLYEIDGPAYVEALSQPDGMRYMLFLIFSDGRPGMTEDVARRIMLGNLKEIAIKVIREWIEDPKLIAAALAMLGLPPDYLTSNETSSSASPTPPSTEASPTSGG